MPAHLSLPLLLMAAACATFSPQTRAESITRYLSGFAEFPGYSYGWANVTMPGAGHYVYQSHVPVNSRPSVRFPIGKAPREDYVLFSAEEEAALDATLKNLEEQESARLVAEKPRRKVRRSSPKDRQPVRSPAALVVIRDGMVCVPEVAFSESADWRDHLVCTEGGQK